MSQSKHLTEAQKLSREFAREAWIENNPERAKASQIARSKAYYEKNKESIKAKMREREKRRWANMSVDARRARNWKSLYGITPEQYEEMKQRQGGVCACCGGDGGDRPLFIDHCHRSKTVRGLLCHLCNAGLGHAKDDVALLRKWIEYLEHHKDKQ